MSMRNMEGAIGFVLGLLVSTMVVALADVISVGESFSFVNIMFTDTGSIIHCPSLFVETENMWICVR